MPKESGRPLKIEVVAPPGAMRSAPRLFATLEQASDSADEYGPIKKSMGRSIPRPSSKPEHNAKRGGNASGKVSVRRVGWNLDGRSTCRPSTSSSCVCVRTRVSTRTCVCLRVVRSTVTFCDAFNEFGIGSVVHGNELQLPNVVGADSHTAVLHVHPLDEHFESIVDVIAVRELRRALRQEAARLVGIRPRGES